MLVDILTRMSVVVGLMLLAMSVISIGHRRIQYTIDDWRRRVLEALPLAAVVVGVLLLNRAARPRVPDYSWIIGWNATSTIHSIEGSFVTYLHYFGFHELTVYFSFMYVYGYAFLLIFPVVAYFALANTIHLRKLLGAYTFNYVIGLIFYVLVIAVGPRNYFPEMIDVVLYDFQPEIQYVTSEVNENINVFPSLHTSLAATIAIFAYRTREEYPIWWHVGTLLAVSVIISTMYLAIHWAIDVVAGLGLAWLSVWLADHTVGSDHFQKVSVKKYFPGDFSRSPTSRQSDD